MTQYGQADPRWAKIRMGKSSTTIGLSGCLITSLGMLVDKTPDTVNTLMTKGNAYVNGALLDLNRAGNILGIPYKGKTSQVQTNVCIAETNHYQSSGIPQHFFVWLGNGEIIDPIDGRRKRNPYKIVSFRLLELKQGESMKLRDQLSPDGLKYAKETAFLLDQSDGNDLNDYFETTHENVKLGDSDINRFLKYMREHAGHIKVFNEYKKLKQDAANGDTAAQKKIKEIDQIIHR